MSKKYRHTKEALSLQIVPIIGFFIFVATFADSTDEYNFAAQLWVISWIVLWSGIILEAAGFFALRNAHREGERGKLTIFAWIVSLFTFVVGLLAFILFLVMLMYVHV